MAPDYARALKAANYYRSLGLCPLPSRMDIKSPMLDTYSEHYGPKPVSEKVYSSWSTTNMQLLTGIKTPTPTKILVVDLDGREALDAWIRISEFNGYVPDKGWMVITGSGGRHLYFLLPDGLNECPSGIIWGLYDTWGKTGRGEWCKHKEIRILADNALVVAPPSIHVDTKKPYEFLLPSPKVYRLPESAPDWLLAMPRLVSPRFTEPPPKRVPVNHSLSGEHYTREEVLAAVGPNKFSIATREWGLVSPVSGPNSQGWCACFVPGREDPLTSRPSGSFHFYDGTFQDRRDLSCVSFFDLSVMLGIYHTWQECRDSMGDRYIGKRKKTEQYQHCY